MTTQAPGVYSETRSASVNTNGGGAGGANLVCNACRYVIRSAKERAEHYRGEWHRYNVKRACAGLTSITSELFLAQLGQLQAKKVAENATHNRQRCACCAKSFASDGAYRAHLQSKKHIKVAMIAEKLAATETSDPSNTPSSSVIDNNDENDEKKNEIPLVDEKDEEKPLNNTKYEKKSEDAEGEDEEYVLQPGESPIPLLTCLFCLTPQKRASIDTLLSHMSTAHGFYIPFQDYISDLEGLLVYLGEKIGIGHVCLYCNGRGRARYPSTFAVQNHMTEKGHCKIRIETEEDEDEMIDFYNFEHESKDDDDDDEINDEASSSSTNNRPGHRSLAGMNEHGELLLTDGSTIGHRQYNHVYNQHQRVRVVDEAVSINQNYWLQASSDQSTLSPSSSATLTVDMTSKNSALVSRVKLPGVFDGERKHSKKFREKWWSSMRKREHLAVGMRNNLQLHYRAQVLF